MEISKWHRPTSHRYSEECGLISTRLVPSNFPVPVLRKVIPLTKHQFAQSKGFRLNPARVQGNAKLISVQRSGPFRLYDLSFVAIQLAASLHLPLES